MNAAKLSSSNHLTVFGAGDASIFLHVRQENAPAVESRDVPQISDTIVPSHRDCLDARRHAATVHTGHWLAPPTGFIMAPFLAHVIDREPFVIKGYNHLGLKWLIPLKCLKNYFTELWQILSPVLR